MALNIQNQRGYLLKKVSEGDVDAQFRHLRIAYLKEAGLKAMLDEIPSQGTLQAFTGS